MPNFARDEILNIGIISMKFLGEAQSYVSSELRVFRVFNLTIMLFLAYFIFINFFHVTDEGYVQTLESFMSISHLLLKYLLLLYYKDEIQELLSSSNHKFWNYRHFSKRIQDTWEKIFLIMNNVQKILFFVSTIIIFMYFLRPLYHGKYSFVLETYVPDAITIDALILLCQFYLFSIAMAIIFSYDIPYLLLCVHIVLQLKLLKYKVQYVIDNMTSEIIMEISSCISHHQFLLAMFSQMQRVFSAMLLFHYFVTMITTCSSLFILMRYSDITVIGIKIASLLLLFGQFAYYTFPADEVTCQFSDIARSLYISKWYSAEIKVQKSLLLIMAKCQRMYYFSGAGFIDINADAFGSVVRKSFSFYAIMRNILSK